MENKKEVSECFSEALKEEEKGKKHKGLLFTGVNEEFAREYSAKAEKNLEFCSLCLERGFDYKLPEEWFYTLYYCALAILAKFGIESRSQRCTAAFLKYAKENNLIEYDSDFIDRITVYKEKELISDVDEREKARYGPSIKNKDIEANYEKMDALCKKAIAQCKDIVFSDKEFKLPEELSNTK